METTQQGKAALQPQSMGDVELVIEPHEIFKRSYNASTRMSHFEGRDEVLVKRTLDSIAAGRSRPGQHEGSLVVEIDSDGCYCRCDPGDHSKDGWAKLEAARAEVILHTPALMRKLGHKAFGRQHAVAVNDSVGYYIVALQASPNKAKIEPVPGNA